MLQNNEARIRGGSLSGTGENGKPGNGAAGQPGEADGLPGLQTNLCRPSAGIPAIGIEIVGVRSGSCGNHLAQSVSSAEPCGKSDGARCIVDAYRFEPAGTIGTDLDMKMIIAGKTQFGSARIAGLEQKRGRLLRVGFVELELVAGAGMIEQGCRCGNDQAIVVIGIGGDAQLRGDGCFLDQRLPAGIGIDEKNCFIFDPQTPARLRREEAPGAVLTGGDLVLMAGPCATFGFADEVTRSLRGDGGRLGEAAGKNGEMQEGIEAKQRFIMRDVFLRLGGGEKGQSRLVVSDISAFRHEGWLRLWRQDHRRRFAGQWRW